MSTMMARGGSRVSRSTATATAVAVATAMTLAMLVVPGSAAAASKRKRSSAPVMAPVAKKINKATPQARSSGPSPASRGREATAAAPGTGAVPQGRTVSVEEAQVTPTPSAASAGSPTSATSGTSATTVKPAKTNVYTFGAMDVEGKLKTPQLLYFLNRVKLELEMSAPDHRSFMKELDKTAEDPNL